MSEAQDNPVHESATNDSGWASRVILALVWLFKDTIYYAVVFICRTARQHICLLVTGVISFRKRAERREVVEVLEKSAEHAKHLLEGV